MRQGNAWMLISALSPAPLHSVSFASLNYGAGQINAMLLLLLILKIVALLDSVSIRQCIMIAQSLEHFVTKLLEISIFKIMPFHCIEIYDEIKRSGEHCFS